MLAGPLTLMYTIQGMPDEDAAVLRRSLVVKARTELGAGAAGRKRSSAAAAAGAAAGASAVAAETAGGALLERQSVVQVGNARPGDLLGHVCVGSGDTAGSPEKQRGLAWGLACVCAPPVVGPLGHGRPVGRSVLGDPSILVRAWVKPWVQPAII